MIEIKEITLDEYYNYPVVESFEKIDSKTKNKQYIIKYPKLAVGNIYRDPDIQIKSEITVSVIKIIWLKTRKVDYFEYAYKPEIKRIDIQKIKVHININEKENR